jgi:hypothetical protein
MIELGMVNVRNDSKQTAKQIQRKTRPTQVEIHLEFARSPAYLALLATRSMSRKVPTRQRGVDDRAPSRVRYRTPGTISAHRRIRPQVFLGEENRGFLKTHFYLFGGL